MFTFLSRPQVQLADEARKMKEDEEAKEREKLRLLGEENRQLEVSFFFFDFGVSDDEIVNYDTTESPR